MDSVEVGLRREAARRRLPGESPRAIARDVGRTRQWVAKWAARYDPHDPGWAEGRSRAPGRVANRTAREVEAQVLEVRKRLEENPWAQVGAPAIGWELEKLGAVVVPQRTIEEILERAGATKRQRPGRRQSKGIPYPAPRARMAGEVVQVDLVGPRHLDGGVRFHALNQIDVASHHAGIEIVTDRGDRRVLAALHALWCRHGVPRRIQFDNGGPSCLRPGSERSCGCACAKASRRCSSRPGSRGATARSSTFNDTFDRRFFRQERFSGLAHLTERADAFERFHNAQHRYSATRGQTPDETTTAATRMPVALAELPAGWPTRGKVEFIRFIRSDHKLRILSRAIPMPDGSAYQYVTHPRPRNRRRRA